MSGSLHRSTALKKDLADVFGPLRHKGSLPNLRPGPSDPGRLQAEQSMSRKLERLKTEFSKPQPPGVPQEPAKLSGPRRVAPAPAQVSAGLQPGRRFAHIFEKSGDLLRSSVQAYLDLQRPAPAGAAGGAGTRSQPLLQIWGEQQLGGECFDTLMR